MAVQTWEDILEAAQLSADERKVIDNIVQKVPEFKDGRLRQADYSRQMTELKKQEKEYSEALTYNQDMKAWADKNVPIVESLIEQGAIDEDANPIWPGEKERLQKELEEAKKAAVAGGEMDPEELDKRVTKIVAESGMSLNVEQYKRLYASEGKKLVEETVQQEYKKFETKFNNESVPFLGGFAASTALAAMKYEKETGKPFDVEARNELFKAMTKEQSFDPMIVVDKMLEPIVREKKTAEEIERKAEERANKIIAERGGMPGGGSEGHFPTGEARGSLQKMLEESAASEGDIETLASKAARTAAAELRSDGKF